MFPTSALWRNAEGSALLEGAIVVPVLMALMFGIYEFSWFFYRQHLMTIGVHDAARYLARSPDACNTASSAWPVEVANAGNLATTGVAAGGSARVSGWTSHMITVTCTPIDNPIGADGLRAYRGDTQIHVVTVTTQLADSSLGFFRLLGLPTPRISVAHSERVIGPG